MKRKQLTRSQRARLFEQHSGICHLCGYRIQSNQCWHVEHVQAIGLGGADNVSNMKPAHDTCHADKTKIEKHHMAKADRRKWIHMGIKKPRTITQWRKFDGTIVRASRDR